MRTLKATFFTIIWLQVGLFVSAQDNVEHHEEHRNEIGVSIAPVYFVNEKSIHPGFHAHYVRNFGESRFGAGLGAELILDENLHQTYSLVFQYNAIEHLHLILAPGLAFEKGSHGDDEDETHEFEGEESHEDDEDSGQNHGALFALHVETVYEFEIGPLILGPAVEFAYDADDIHFSLGLHIGFPF
jgi:hypothetical protein